MLNNQQWNGFAGNLWREENKCFRCFLQCEAYKTWRANRDDMLMQKWQYKVISAPIRRKWGTR